MPRGEHFGRQTVQHLRRRRDSGGGMISVNRAAKTLISEKPGLRTQVGQVCFDARLKFRELVSRKCRIQEDVGRQSEPLIEIVRQTGSIQCCGGGPET